MFEGNVQRYDSLRETVDNTVVMKRLLEGTLEKFEIPLNVTKLGAEALKGLKLKHLVVHKGVETLNPAIKLMPLEHIEIYSSGLVPCEDTNYPTKDYGIFYKASKDCIIEFKGDISAIPEQLLRGNSTISSSIVIPEGVKSIGDYAFYGCTSLKDISLPKSLESIGNHSFQNVKAPFDSLPEGVKSIGDYAFYGCDITSMSLPDKIEVIPSYAFYYCDSLLNISLPKNCISIGNEAFRLCKKLESVYIPEKVIEIGDYAFYGCTSLSSVQLSKDLERIGDYAFKECPISELVIPEKVIEIGDYAFGPSSGYASHLTKVTFKGNALQSIGNYAFYGCKAEEINLPSSVTTLGMGAFIYNRDLRSMVLPEKITVIPTHLFTSCDALESLTFQGVITSLGEGMLLSCINLKSFTIPNSVTSIPNLCLAQTGLTDITIPSSIETIGESAFSGCKSLQSITFEGDNLTHLGKQAFADTGFTSFIFPESVTDVDTELLNASDNLIRVVMNSTMEEVPPHVVKNCTNLKEVDFKNAKSIGYGAFYGCSGLTSITIPEGITSIGASAFAFSGLTSITIPEGITQLYSVFQSCESLVEVELPKSLTKIDYYAFYGCNNLTSIDIPEGVTSIGQSAFGYTGLTSVTIPANVTSIAKQAFQICSNLKEIRMQSSTPPTLGSYNAFPYSNSGFKIYVPKGSLSAYQGASQWSNTNIKNKIVEY